MSKKRPLLFNGFLASIPRQMDAESNPRQPHVAGFPRNLVYTRVERSEGNGQPPRVRESCYWPDLDSYHQDIDTREMHYVSHVESPYSVRVVHEKATGAWTVFKSRGTTVRWKAYGADFRSAMMHATMVGVAPDEPIDEDDDYSDC